MLVKNRPAMWVETAAVAGGQRILIPLSWFNVDSEPVLS